MLMNENNDHDLLIELRTEVQNIRTDIKDLKGSVYDRISRLEKDKADKDEFNFLQDKVNKDIDSRIIALEKAEIDPQEHKNILNSMNTNNIYLKWLVALIVILIGVMSWHIVGIKF